MALPKGRLGPGLFLHQTPFAPPARNAGRNRARRGDWRVHLFHPVLRVTFFRGLGARACIKGQCSRLAFGNIFSATR